MSSRTSLVFKFASEDWEFEQIHRLNYRTFVEEIPQHHASPSHRLVDKFHAENTYLICLSDQKLVGMLAVRANRPFSLDQKLENVDSHLPAGRKICEIRLLAVEKRFRGAQVLQGILALLWQHGVERGYDLAIISGTTRQFRLYQHLGFVPFGPVVGTGEAQFQPMYVTLQTFESTAREFLRSSPSSAFHPSAVNLLPGPVAVRREVRRAFEQAPESHRGDTFVEQFQSTRRALCELVHAKAVEIQLGSGTLANDLIAAQLSLVKSRGIILSNGEFGQRLIDHGTRFGLDFDELSWDWGQPFDLERLRQALQTNPRPEWVWCTHCETSTGVLNDIDSIQALCSEFNARLCVDCISSIGTGPVNLSQVFLSSASSGKGLRSYPGASMVFYNHKLEPSSGRLPRYLDLALYAANGGIPFTFSSNLLHALQASIRRVNWEERFAELTANSAWLRESLEEAGFEVIGKTGSPSPAVVSLALPRTMCSQEIGQLMKESGYLLSYNSEYLRGRNWIQICLMGECRREKLVSVLNTLKRVCQRQGILEVEPKLPNA